jgi:hypothetical protein
MDNHQQSSFAVQHLQYWDVEGVAKCPIELGSLHLVEMTGRVERGMCPDCTHLPRPAAHPTTESAISL